MDRRKVAANQALQDLFQQYLAGQIEKSEFERVGARLISLADDQTSPESQENPPLVPEALSEDA
jgi:hypothetical protein